MPNMNKPLSEWTLGEVKDFCKDGSCVDCPLYDRIVVCKLTETPVRWELDWHWTDQERADAKSLMELIAGANNLHIERKDNNLWLMIPVGMGKEQRVWLRGHNFRTLREGERARLRDIAREEEEDG